MSKSSLRQKCYLVTILCRIIAFFYNYKFFPVIVCEGRFKFESKVSKNPRRNVRHSYLGGKYHTLLQIIY